MIHTTMYVRMYVTGHVFFLNETSMQVLKEMKERTVTSGSGTHQCPRSLPSQLSPWQLSPPLPNAQLFSSQTVLFVSECHAAQPLPLAPLLPVLHHPGTWNGYMAYMVMHMYIVLHERLFLVNADTTVNLMTAERGWEWRYDCVGLRDLHIHENVRHHVQYIGLAVHIPPRQTVLNSPQTWPSDQHAYGSSTEAELSSCSRKSHAYYQDHRCKTQTLGDWLRTGCDELQHEVEFLHCGGGTVEWHGAVIWRGVLVAHHKWAACQTHEMPLYWHRLPEQLCHSW